MTRLYGDHFNRFALTDRVIPKVLCDAAERWGSRDFVTLPGGELTFSELPQFAARTSDALARVAPSPSNPVALLTENCIEWVATMWGNAWRGGITVPINFALRGPGIVHILNQTEAPVLVIEAAKLADLEPYAKELPHLRHAVIVGDSDYPTWPGLSFVRWSDLHRGVDSPQPASVSFSDPVAIMYTSGTTGAAKGIVVSHHHYYCTSVPPADNWGWGPGDHVYTPMPLYHIQAHLTVLFAGVVAGNRVTIRRWFSASRFWADVAACGATHVSLVLPAINVLLQQEPSSIEKEHKVRTLTCTSKPDVAALASRFGVQSCWEGYGMTEAAPNPRDPSRPYDGDEPSCVGPIGDLFHFEIVDDSDVPVPHDGVATGEIVLRPKLPYAMMTEYFHNPTATATAFRNLWFHTGDLASIDGRDFVFFRGRKKDSMRHRGENVSAFELEQAVTSHPAVVQAAAFGLRAELGDDDIKVDLVLAPGTTLTGKELIVYLADRVPFFMLPRYVQFRSELPMTPSLKIEKYKLAAEGAAGADYDGGDRGGRSRVADAVARHG